MNVKLRVIFSVFILSFGFSYAGEMRHADSVAKNTIEKIGYFINNPEKKGPIIAYGTLNDNIWEALKNKNETIYYELGYDRDPNKQNGNLNVMMVCPSKLEYTEYLEVAIDKFVQGCLLSEKTEENQIKMIVLKIFDKIDKDGESKLKGMINEVESTGLKNVFSVIIAPEDNLFDPSGLSNVHIIKSPASFPWKNVGIFSGLALLAGLICYLKFFR